MTILYGTHLSVLVKQVLKKESCVPLTAKEVAGKLANLDDAAQQNLIRRVRRVLNELTFHHISIIKQERHVKNIVEYTYQFKELCSEEC